MTSRISLITFACVSALLVRASANDAVQFNRDIRPILAETCFHCHGPDPGARKAGLRLDTEAGFFYGREKDGKKESPTVVKGQPEKSPMYQRLITTDEDDVMPPKKEHKDLKPEQIALIKKWIEEGAPWQAHWAFIKPERAPLPEIRNQKLEVKNPIDRFVFAKLEQNGLTPAPEADPRSLFRRLSLDLTGLPPSPEDADAFNSECSANPKSAIPNPQSQIPDAVLSRWVDKLMQSEQYGEHRARYWLDAARYADTHGMHFDNYREMWPYRDWVINAFNNNQPFDKFTVEQIAGDLLPKRTESQLIATGFQRCNITTNEGGTIDEENLALYASDRVQTIGWVYMGITTNCAQCHDHKFDPFTARDYYSMSAFFRNTTQGAKDGNVKDSAPILVVPAMADRPRWDALPKQIASAGEERTKRKQEALGEFTKWLAAATPDALDKDLPQDGLVAHLPLNEGEGNEVAAICGPQTKFKATGEVAWKPDGKLGPAPVMHEGSTFDLGDLGDFESNQKFSYGAWIKAGRNGVFGGIIARMDEKNEYRGWDLFQSDSSLSVHIVSKWDSDALKVTTSKPVLKPGQWQHVFVTYNGSAKPGGVKIYVDGVEEKLKAETNTLKAKSTIRTQTPLRIGQRSGVQIFDGGSVQDMRLYTRTLDLAEVKKIASIGPLRAILAAASDKRKPQQRNALYDHFLTTRDEKYIEIGKNISSLETERAVIKERSPVTHIQEEVMGTKPAAFILMRGQYDKKGEQVEASTPGFLSPLPEGAPRNRLGLAQWIVDEKNPLTARVTVNRFWQEIFGTGLVKTSEDFGIMGTAPSHPELLDWLAVEFRESGWDVKRLFKLMVMSATYRQSSSIADSGNSNLKSEIQNLKLERDLDNRLLSRGPRFRMDAEMLRDYALAASGTLSPKMGGASTKPYQPENVWDQVGIGNTRNYVQDKGENLYRRTVYNFWKRMAPPPNLDIFNAPSREVCSVRRERTNTPLQALVTMNDTQFVEAARNLAQHAMQQTRDDDALRIHFIALHVLCRPLTDREKGIVLAGQKDLRTFYQANPNDAKALIGVGETKADERLDAASLAAWTMVCNEMMNLDEVLNK